MLIPFVPKFRPDLSVRLKDFSEKQVPAKLKPIVDPAPYYWLLPVARGPLPVEDAGALLSLIQGPGGGREEEDVHAGHDENGNVEIVQLLVFSCKQASW